MDWREFRREVAKTFRSPTTWVHFAVILTSPFWMPAAIYLYFRSFVFAPSGLFAWLSIFALGAWILVRMVGSIRTMARCKREVRIARRELEANRPGSQERYDRMRAVLRSSRAPHTFAGSFSLITLFIPAIVSLVVWSTLQLPVGELVNRKLVIHSRSERLQLTLHWFEARGLFTPLIK